MLKCKHAPVAQWIEQETSKLLAVGSIPTRGTTRFYQVIQLMLPIFITSNQNKADYLAKALGINLEHQKIELDEIQSTNSLEIVEHKARQAYDIIQKPVLVEDVSLAAKGIGKNEILADRHHVER